MSQISTASKEGLKAGGLTPTEIERLEAREREMKMAGEIIKFPKRK